jgi:hypothetical protein
MLAENSEENSSARIADSTMSEEAKRPRKNAPDTMELHNFLDADSP